MEPDRAEPMDDDALRRAEEYGVDLTLLYENLKRTPTERLERHRAVLAFMEDVGEAGRRHRVRAQAAHSRPVR